MRRPLMMTMAAAALYAPWAARADSASWRMLPVTSYQARVETYEPVWNKEHEVWVSGVPSASGSFEAQYAATLDSVTTSSVEGALMYLQRDCIDIGATPWAAAGGCVRKNDVKVITFLEVTIANPNAALAEYQSDRFTYPEFCPFVEMKNGACIFTNDSATPAVVIDHPAECKQYNGIDGQPHIGPCVGAEAFPTDNIAPYFDTVWFSYPSSCVMKTWKEGKSAACRAQYPGGLCPFGTTPDGVTCQFSYKILGFLRIDDLVGINAKVAQFANGSAVGDEEDAAADAVSVNSSQDIYANPGINSASGSLRADDDDDEDDDDDDDDAGASGLGDQGANAGDDQTEKELTTLSMDKNFKPWKCPDGRRCYENFAEFCEANNTEFHSTDKDRTLGLSAVKSIEFWGFPSDHRVNKNRTAFMIQMYNTRVAELNKNASALGKMTPLPLDLSAITKKNPACYLNSLACYNAHYGCERHSYAQVCSVCREMGAKCVIKQPSYEFPQLARAPFTVPESALRSRVVKAPNQKASANAAQLLTAPSLAAGLLAAVVALLSM